MDFQKIHVEICSKLRGLHALLATVGRRVVSRIGGMPGGGAGLLHAWDTQDCSLFTNALFYSPVRPYRPPSWPGPTSRVHASMRPSRKSDRYVRYVRYATLRALHAAMEATAVHEVGGAPLLAVNMA